MSARNWDDLKPRVMSAIVMAIVGAAAVWAGGMWFRALITIACGLMTWELARMIAPDQESRHATLGVNTAIAVAWSGNLSPIFMAVALVMVVGFGAYVLKQNRLIFVGYCALIILAGYGFIYLRQDLGIVWLLWMLLVVIASDVGGYVAGRMLGGPKFWPKVSPKKTWSGTIAGWIGAALVGLYFSAAYGLSGELWLVSVLVAFAAQMGDIAESAIKRKTGIKDSSNLIPGHGGFMDRFDGMLGASLVVILLVVLTGFPHGAG
ncbi:MAG: phosphatidate cytidylyltransferase [Marinosulfonomonas sp.]|nr:phosphatidate cytidylyltransferase [Marinosulfonomonas sp.]